jgi:hypothetical protein
MCGVQAHKVAIRGGHTSLITKEATKEAVWPPQNGYSWIYVPLELRPGVTNSNLRESQR